MVHQCISFFSQAAVYKTGSVCAAFLANVDNKSDATVNFNGNSYHLPAWSVSILPDCKNVALNTAKVCLIFSVAPSSSLAASVLYPFKSYSFGLSSLIWSAYLLFKIFMPLVKNFILSSLHWNTVWFLLTSFFETYE